MGRNIKFIDISKCDGCRACSVACKNWNDLPIEIEPYNGTIQSHQNVTANTWNVVINMEVVQPDGSLAWHFRHTACLHCEEPSCALACSENVITKREDGAVVIDEEGCVGCGYCVTNCPFDIVQLKKVKINGKTYEKASKCNLCEGRIAEGLEPACSRICHTDAIQYGDYDELMAEAEERLEVVKKRYPDANIYSPAGVGGTTTIYLLTEKPSLLGLPENPEVPSSIALWKHVVQPVGKMLGVGAAVAVAGLFVTKKIVQSQTHHTDSEHKEGEDHAG